MVSLICYAVDWDVNVDLYLKQCSITQCTINTYCDESSNTSWNCQRCPTNYYSSIGARSINGCSECPYHRGWKANDSSWCPILECMQVFITHNNGLYNKTDGIYHNLGKRYRNSWDDYVTVYI